jgi:hypothetical protein
MCPPPDHPAARWEAQGAGHRATGHTPRQRPKGVELHKRIARGSELGLPVAGLPQTRIHLHAVRWLADVHWESNSATLKANPNVSVLR